MPVIPGDTDEAVPGTSGMNLHSASSDSALPRPTPQSYFDIDNPAHQYLDSRFQDRRLQVQAYQTAGYGTAYLRYLQYRCILRVCETLGLTFTAPRTPSIVCFVWFRLGVTDCHASQFTFNAQAVPVTTFQVCHWANVNPETMATYRTVFGSLAPKAIRELAKKSQQRDQFSAKEDETLRMFNLFLQDSITLPSPSQIDARLQPDAMDAATIALGQFRELAQLYAPRRS